MKRGSFKSKYDSCYPWIFLVLFILAWQLIAGFFKIPTYILPTPLVVISKGIEIWRALVHHLLVTLKEVLVGFAIGSMLGSFLVFFISYFPFVRKIFPPYIVAFQTVPELGLAPQRVP